MGNLFLFGALITLPISLSSSFCPLSYPLIHLAQLFSSSLIVSIVFFFLGCPPFYHLQFLSNLPQYSLSYFLSDHPNNFFAINLPGNSLLSNIPSSLSYRFTFSMSCRYSLLNSLIASFAFPRFSLPSQVSDSTVNPFYCTRYLFFPLIRYLFKISFTSHSSSPSIITGASCSLFCPSTCPIYLYILLTLTTRCILIVSGSSNSTMFNDTIFFTL